MFKKLNKVVFGIIHRFSSATFRLFGFDNYAWCATSFVVAGVTSLFLYNEAMKLAAAEKDPEIAQMRQSNAVGFYAISSIGAALFALAAVMKSRNAAHADIFYLILSGTGYDKRLARYGPGV